MFNTNLEISQPFLVRSQTILTGSYVAGTAFSMDNHNTIGLEVGYLKGDETSMQLKIEVSNDGGNSYAQQMAESTSGGTITASLGERSFAASGTGSILVNPVRARLVKISVKATSGTPTGSCTIKAYPLWS